MLSRIIALCVSVLALPLQAQQIAITIDDLPYVLTSRTTPQEGLQIVREVNAALKAHNITATGFVIGNQINAVTIPAIDAFSAAGHTVGNHSWSHPDYDTLSRWAFRRETRRTNRA